MKSLPPHLPKKENNQSQKALKQSLFYFLSCTLIAIAASLATVFVAFSWVVPRAIPEVPFYTFEHKTLPPEPTVDTSLLTHISERQALLFDTRKQLAKEWYPAESALASGVFLTSDGWVVFPFSSIEPFDKKNFEVVDNKGVVYPLESVFVDKDLSLLYLKVRGEGLRFISFPNWNTLTQDASVVGKNGSEYTLTKVSGIQKNSAIKLPAEIWKQHYLYSVEAPVQGFLFSDQGEFLGLAREGGLLPGWYVESSFLSLLSKQKLTYSAFSWKGEIVDRRLQNGFVKETIGFFVTEGDLDKNGLKAGDVIVKINNQEFSLTTLSRVVLQSPEMVTLEIVRNGELLQKTLPKNIITF